MLSKHNFFYVQQIFSVLFLFTMSASIAILMTREEFNNKKKKLLNFKFYENNRRIISNCHSVRYKFSRNQNGLDCHVAFIFSH